MKGGAVFNKTLSDTELRNALGMLGTDLQGNGVTSAVYVSPLRLLGIQERASLKSDTEYGNIHAVLVTLPVAGTDFAIEYIPDIPKNYFKGLLNGYYALTDRLQRELAGQPLPHTPRLVDKDAVPTRTQSRQIAALESGTPTLPETVQQRISTMAGLTSKESTPLSDAKRELAKLAPPDIKADAIIDAAVSWVKAWNVEHVAPKGKRKEATAARKAAEKVLDDLEGGKTKAFVPLPHKESSSNAASEGSSSSSSPSAAPPPPQGPSAAEREEERLSQEALAAMKGGRRKTRRSSKKRRTTRRR